MSASIGALVAGVGVSAVRSRSLAAAIAPVAVAPPVALVVVSVAALARPMATVLVPVLALARRLPVGVTTQPAEAAQQPRRRLGSLRARGQRTMTERNISFDDLIALVEERSNAPVARLAPDLAVTLCPSCLDNGRHEVLVIRRDGDGGAVLEDCAA